ncbi:hypothetical protein HK405_012002, partial [Cladochytrium tenue]
MGNRARTTTAASSAAVTTATPASPTAPGRRGRLAAAAASGTLLNRCGASLPTLSLVAWRQVVQHLDPFDLMELRWVSKGVRSTVDQAVDSVGFAARHLRRWILESTGEQSWDAVTHVWMATELVEFWRAARYERVEILRLLLDRGASCNLQLGYGDTALHIAARNGNPDTVSLLLDRGASIELRDRDGQTALHKAVTESSLETVQLLLSRGANLNAQDFKQISVLAYAVNQDNIEVLSFLLRNGAKTELGPKGQRPINFVSKSRHGIQFLKALLNHEAAWDDQDSSLFDFITEYAEHISDDNDASLLLDKAKRIPSRSHAKRWALAACARGHEKTVRKLIQLGVDLNVCEPDEKATRDCHSPLYLAALGGHTSVIRLMLSHGAKLANTDPINRFILDTIEKAGDAPRFE